VAIAAEFDPDKQITFTGKVEKVMWTNPHIYTWVSVRQEDGTELVYHVEGGATNGLFRSGWRSDSLHAGDTVTISGWRSKNPRVAECRAGNHHQRGAEDLQRKRARKSCRVAYLRGTALP
jgi:hypothetical protein